MTKHIFFYVFKPAFVKAFSEENIRSAYNPDLVLNSIGAYPNTDVVAAYSGDEKEPKTPYTAKSLRRFQICFAKNSTKAFQRKLFKANMTLTAEREIAMHRAECFN